MKSKILSILLSAVLAFGLWLYVVNYISPDSEATLTEVPVVFEGETLLNERGMMLTSGNKATVTLKVSGNRADLNKINRSNVSAKIDLTKVYDPGEHELAYTPIFPSDVRSGSITVEYRSPVKISVEQRVDKPVPVRIAWSGAVPDDYIANTNAVVLDYTDISVSGPSSVVSRIDHARIDVELSGRSESISENYLYTLCDAEGNPVDVAQITTNTAEVHLDVNIQRLKEIPLVLNVNYGGGATADNTTITIDPATIKVSGSDARLENLTEIVLGTIDLATIERSDRRSFPITLPEGVANISGTTDALVDISFSGLTVKKFKVSQFKAVNIPEGMEYVVLNDSLEVTLRGPTALINSITADDILITVDLADKEAGTTTVKAIVTIWGDENQPVGEIGSLSVSVTIRPIPPEEEPTE